MERMTGGAWLFRCVEQAAWEVRRGARAFMRRFGVAGGGLLAFFVVGVAAWSVQEQQRVQISSLKTQLVEREKASSALPAVQRVDAAAGVDGRARLTAFEDYLLPHEDIPLVVQDLLRLAEDEGLSIQRGEYRAQADLAGGFMRYRMSLPVKGAAPSIYQFMQTALRTQKTLALDSVQFKRERIESIDIEARIQWVVLTRLPLSTARESRSTPALSADRGDSR